MKKNDVTIDKQEELSKMYEEMDNVKKYINGKVHSDDLTLEDIVKEIRAVRAEVRSVKKLVLEIIQINEDNDITDVEAKLPFKFPLNSLDLDIAEQYINDKENYDNLVSDFVFFKTSKILGNSIGSGNLRETHS